MGGCIPCDHIAHVSNESSALSAVVLELTREPGKVALVDGPSTSNPVKRQLMPLKRLSITPIKCTIPSGARSKTLEKAYKEAEVEKKWAESSWAKTIACKAAKAKLTDFDRFKVMVARKTRARVVNKAIKAMKK
eukprot:767433-Hanusia_phi.AAC.7